MSLNYLLVDTTTGKRQKGSVAGAGFTAITDQDYDVGGGGQSAFVTTAPFTSLSTIDVWRGGQLMREGQDWTRTPGTSTITFAYTVPQNAWVRIRIYS